MEKSLPLKNAESRYCIVEWTSDSYTQQSYNYKVKYVIKAGELVHDAVYLNPLVNFNQRYTPLENENQRQNIVKLNIVISAKVKVQ